MMKGREQGGRGFQANLNIQSPVNQSLCKFYHKKNKEYLIKLNWGDKMFLYTVSGLLKMKQNWKYQYISYVARVSTVSWNVYVI